MRKRKGISEQVPAWRSCAPQPWPPRTIMHGQHMLTMRHMQACNNATVNVSLKRYTSDTLNAKLSFFHNIIKSILLIMVD